MGAFTPLPETRSRWLLGFVKNSMIFDVNSIRNFWHREIVKQP